MKRILLGVPVHQDADIFKAYLASLDRLVVPEGYKLDRMFYLHNCDELAAFVAPTDRVKYNHDKTKYDTAGPTHSWTAENLTEVAKMKNEMMQICVKEGYDYYFLVDSDLIIHPNTLKVLLSRDKDIISEIFWTEWMENSGDLGPNCWDRDMSDFQNKERYRIPGVHQTGGTGALMLVKASVLRKVNYTPVSCVSFSIWEDRAFAIRAEVQGYKIYIDTTLPARHLYRRSDYEKYMKKVGSRENKG